jgi:hypothetical protein
MTDSVAFVTSAWQRDWSVVLDPERFRMVLESHRHEFPVRLLVLNNFRDPKTESRARQAAEHLHESGLVTDILLAREILTEEALAAFGFVSAQFWQANPWFSTVHLAALYYLRGKADWLFYINGDVRLERACDWVPRALAVLARTPGIRGLNLCRNIYRDFYPNNCQVETDDLWISEPWDPANGLESWRHFALSDHSYLIPVAASGGWQFDAPEEFLRKFYPLLPIYAQPCFEMYYAAAMSRCGYGHGVLRPKDGCPVIKHKNFPNNWKIHLYKLLGYYRPNRRHGTQLD